MLSIGGAAQAQVDYDGTQDVRLSYTGIAADDVDVTIDGQSFGTVDGNGMISVSLYPGEHEVLGVSASGAALRQTILVPDDGSLIKVLVLKSESLGQVRDYTLVTNGTLGDGTLPVPGALSFSFVDPSGAVLELTDFNMVRVARIETSSFSPAGGIPASSSLFLTDQFSIVDNAIVADSPDATISQIISSLGVGEYEVEIAAGDDGLGLPYDGVAFLRSGGREEQASGLRDPRGMPWTDSWRRVGWNGSRGERTSSSASRTERTSSEPTGLGIWPACSHPERSGSSTKSGRLMIPAEQRVPQSGPG